MEGILDFHPVIERLLSISPARFTALRECPLREVWTAAHNIPLLPISPKARVGTIAHRLLAEAGKGLLIPDRDKIETRWDHLLEQTEQEMLRGWVDRHLLPLSRSVPDIEVRKIRAVSRAAEIAVACTTEIWPHASQKPVDGYGFELLLQSKDGLVKGFIDAAIPSSQGPILRDFKTGLIFESIGVVGSQVKEVYEIQIKMYAALYEEQFGCWPAMLQIVPLSGTTREVMINQKECRQLLNEARKRLRQINEIIASSNSVVQTEKNLALPGANCSYCLYRPSCTTYQDAAVRMPNAAWPKDVFGNMQEKNLLGNSRILLTISTNAGIISIKGLSQGTRHPALLSLNVGNKVGLFNLSKKDRNRSFEETLFTTVYRMLPGLLQVGD